jgi:hypothetical protein
MNGKGRIGMTIKETKTGNHLLIIHNITTKVRQNSEILDILLKVQVQRSYTHSKLRCLEKLTLLILLDQKNYVRKVALDTL